MPQQAQYSTSEQLAEVKRLAEHDFDLTKLQFSETVRIYSMANRLGLYDAADLIKARTKEIERLARNDFSGILDW